MTVKFRAELIHGLQPSGVSTTKIFKKKFSASLICDLLERLYLFRISSGQNAPEDGGKFKVDNFASPKVVEKLNLYLYYLPEKVFFILHSNLKHAWKVKSHYTILIQFT